MKLEVKFNDSDDSKLYVTGCTHLNHNPKWDTPLWKMRGYNSADEMTDGIIDTINKICRPVDNLLVLGDFCLNTVEKQFNELVHKINCNLWFIRGNHNNPWESMYLDFCEKEYGVPVQQHMNWYDGKVSYLGDYINLRWNKRKFVCNHYPFAIWDNMHHGVASLCSHSHGSYNNSLPAYINERQLDCGWDVHGKPLSFEDIENIMRYKKFKPKDHHDESTT